MHKILLVFIVSIMMVTVTVTTINANTNHWAVLVAGSHGFVNYRHQSSRCMPRISASQKEGCPRTPNHSDGIR